MLHGTIFKSRSLYKERSTNPWLYSRNSFVQQYIILLLKSSLKNRSVLHCLYTLVLPFSYKPYLLCLPRAWIQKYLITDEYLLLDCVQAIFLEIRKLFQLCAIFQNYFLQLSCFIADFYDKNWLSYGWIRSFSSLRFWFYFYFLFSIYVIF